MQEVAVVGLDLAKNVFQVHGVAAGGGVVVRKQLRRGQVLSFFEGLSPCLAASRPAPQPTTGPERSGRSVMRCG